MYIKTRNQILIYKIISNKLIIKLSINFKFLKNIKHLLINYAKFCIKYLYKI